MADSLPNDGYREALAQKIWELIPGYYRHEDGLAATPGVLRALVEVMAEQAAVLRRSQDRLWEDQGVESADDWAIPYLAELVATRLVSALNPRGRRVDVAKTVYYRRRSGTLRVLEELASDIARWESKVVEEFRRLARAHHNLDPAPSALRGRLRGRFSGTPAGGTADLRRAVSAEATGGPFDEFHYTPDLRRPRGTSGRHGIQKLGFHLFRLVSYRIERATPGASLDAVTGTPIATFDPSGRDIALFNPAARPERWDDWKSALEWELPTPMRCRILGHAEYVITDQVIGALRAETGLSAADAASLLPLRNVLLKDEPTLRALLRSLPNGALFDPSAQPARYRVLLRDALSRDCAKHFLTPDYLAVEDAVSGTVAREHMVAGSLSLPGSPPAVPARSLVIAPETGRFALLPGAALEVRSVTYHYGFSGGVGAGPFARPALPEATRSYSFDLSGSRVLFDDPGDDSGVIEVADSATYTDLHDRLAVAELSLQASDGKRPYLQLAQHFVLQAQPAGDAVLTLDGLWLGARDGDFALRLAGDYERVHLRFCTLDPGGRDAGGNPLPAVGLVVQGHIEELHIEGCILASLRVSGSGMVERAFVRDSIVTGDGSGVAAVLLPLAELQLDRVSIEGGVEVQRLHASEALLAGHTEVVDTQWGCVRFSAYALGSRLPRPYESHALSDFHGIFSSRRFGDPGFFQLSAAAPSALSTGAESGSEIGAFSGLNLPIKGQGLAAKVDEYMPFGLIPAWILET